MGPKQVLKMDTQHDSDVNTRQTSIKLKFGIDRLLSSETDGCARMDSQYVAKPQPTVAIPCSDCVTSLFRCCSLDPGNNGHDQHGFLGHQHRIVTSSSASSIFTVQPIRPFATRPGKNN